MKLRYLTAFFLTVLLLANFACMGETPIERVEPDTPDNEEPYEVRAVNSMVKITPTMDFTTFKTTIGIEGTRGEHEAFQVLPVLSGNTEEIHDVMLYASDLVKGNDVIPSENINLYLEHYLLITVPSDFGCEIGWYPDALAPLTTPFDVTSPVFPHPVWVDVKIPYDAVPGVYDGEIVFYSSDAGNVVFEYTLEVWNITMPKQLYIKANFGIDQEDIVWAHNLGSGWNYERAMEMSHIYAKFLADRYISTHGLPILHPYMTVNPDRRSYTIDFTPLERDLQYYIDELDLSSIQFPMDRFDTFPEGFIGMEDDVFSPDFNARFIDYVNQVSEYLSNRGCLDRTFIFLNDEPSTIEHYEYVRQSSDLVRSANIYPPYLLTEQPAPQQPEFGSLLDYVDIFVTNIMVLYWGGEESAVRAGGEDKEEWIYTNSSVHPLPSVSIDKQGVEPRIFVWYTYQRGFRGIFYGSANDWSNVNPWEDPRTFGKAMGNGCNNLMYPGTFINQFTGQNDVDAPISSIRLELTREGLEDAELLYMLGKGAPLPLPDDFMSEWWEYSIDPHKLLSIRRGIAHLIMEQAGT